MPLEANEILNYLGIDGEIESLDDFKSKHGERFMTEESARQNDKLVSSIVGHRMGELETALWRGVKDIGVDIDRNEYKDKKLNEYMDDVLNKVGSTYSSKIEELESKSGSTNDEQLKALEAEATKYKTKLNDFKDLHESTVTDLQSKLEERDSNLKNYKIDIQKNGLMSQLELREMNQFEQKGFQSEINERFKFDLNENDELEVYDANSGKPIANKDKAGEFAKPVDALKGFAVENGFWKKNPHDEKRTRKSPFGGAGDGNERKEKKPLREVPEHVRNAVG